MPRYSGQDMDISIEKINERLDFGSDEIAIREMLQEDLDPSVRYALLRLKEVIREWRRQ